MYVCRVCFVFVLFILFFDCFFFFGILIVCF